MVKPKHLTDSDSFVRLWCHESSRVFRFALLINSSFGNLILFMVLAIA